MNKELTYKNYGKQSKKVINELRNAGVELSCGQPLKTFTWDGNPVSVYIYLVKERIIIFRQPEKMNPIFEQAITAHCRKYGLSVRVIHAGGSLNEAFDAGELQSIINNANKPRQLVFKGIRDVNYINV